MRAAQECNRLLKQSDDIIPRLRKGDLMQIERTSDQRNFLWFLLTAIILAGSLALASPSAAKLRSTQPQDEDPAETELQKGTGLLRQKQFEDALKSFKRANDMRKKNCAHCLQGMMQAYFRLEAYKSAAETADKLIALAPTDKPLLLIAYNLKGLSLQQLAEVKDQKKLGEAEAAFRKGIELDSQGHIPILRFNLGFTLMQLNRDPDGIAELKKFVELKVDGDDVERAQKLIENPRRARENYAPDFAMTTADGEHITLDDLRGKVVVLDFWGTWCPPCVESIPSLRSLNKKFSKEPSFVLIGVSSDSDEDTWRSFTTNEKMVWPQYLDRDSGIQRAFRVNAFPTYIVIDHEGIIRFRSSGTSWERSAYLSDAIKKYVKVVAKTDAAN